MHSSGLHRSFLILLLAFAGVALGRAQSAAEYGAVTSKAGVTAATVGAKVPKPTVTLPTPASNSSPSHLPTVSAESVAAAAAANRRALQERAGPDAAKLSLSSVPDHAQVWIDSQFVGTTPLELTLAPGRHRVLMSATGMEVGQRELELVAKQAREVALPLKPRYPQKVSLH